MGLVQNERIKLLAAAISTTGVATIVTAVIAPVAATFYGSMSVTVESWWVIGLIWLLVGSALHLVAQAILGRLRE